mgnify:CR=1 FL=1
MASLLGNAECLGGFYVGIRGGYGARRANIVAQAGSHKGLALYHGRKVCSVKIWGCLIDALVVRAELVGAQEIRPTADALCGYAVVVAHRGDKRRNIRHFVAQSARRERLPAALARAVDYQNFSVPFGLVHQKFEGAHRAQVEHAEEAVVAVVRADIAVVFKFVLCERFVKFFRLAVWYAVGVVVERNVPLRRPSNRPPFV